MSWANWFLRKPPQTQVENVLSAPVRVDADSLDQVLTVLEAHGMLGDDKPKRVPLEMPKLPPGVAPKVAMDAAPGTDLYSSLGLLSVDAALAFPGYPVLAEMAMKAEYRNITGRIAAEMTRKWIRFSSASKQDKTARIEAIEKKLKELGVRDLFRDAARHEGDYGRAQIFVDMGTTDALEMKVPLYLTKWKVKKNSLRGFRVIEPVWTYPYRYTALNPLRGDFYKPQSWFVMSQEIHDTRLLMFNTRPVSDLFKPAYNFGGLSLIQLCQPVVEAWLKTKRDVGQIVSNYRTQALRTNLGNMLQSGATGQMMARAAIFTKVRDNSGLMLLNNDATNPEELIEKNTSLSELSNLQAQSQEHMAASAQIPLVVLTGITPSGLNASSEGEIRVYYDWIHDQQEAMFRKPLEQVVQLVQISEFGDIDEDIVFNFVELFQLNGKDLARVREQNANAAQVYTTIGAVSGDEVREQIAADPESGWDNLNVEDPNFQPTVMPTQKQPTRSEEPEEAA